MTRLPTQSLAQKLDALPQETVLECLAYLHKRRAHLDQLERLLQARLASLMAPSAPPQTDELLTADEAAARLKLSRPRVTNWSARADSRRSSLGSRFGFPPARSTQTPPPPRAPDLIARVRAGDGLEQRENQGSPRRTAPGSRR